MLIRDPDSQWCRTHFFLKGNGSVIDWLALFFSSVCPPTPAYTLHCRRDNLF